VKREAAQLHNKHLENLLNDAKAANCWKKTSALTYLIWTEQNCRCYSAYQQFTEPKSAGGLAYLIDKNPMTNDATMILDQDKMESTLLDYSRTHFATVQGSPFTVAPLSNLLQYDGLTPFGNKILKGCIHLEHLPFNKPKHCSLIFRTNLMTKLGNTPWCMMNCRTA